jgi:hypothetical protein
LKREISPHTPLKRKKLADQERIYLRSNGKTTAKTTTEADPLRG